MKKGTQNAYCSWADPKNAGQPIRYMHEEENIPQSFLIKGVLHHKPAAPVKPTQTIVTLKPTHVTCQTGESLEDMLRKLPAGTPLRDIKINTSKGTCLTFEKREETENIFFDEEMKVYFVQQLAYEAAMKLWAIKVMCFRQAEIADASVDFEKALAETQKRGLRHPNKFEDDVTRSWLKTLDDQTEDGTIRAPADPTPSPEMVELGNKMRDGKLEKIEFGTFSVFVDATEEKTSVRELVKEVLQETLDESITIEVEEDDKSS